MSDPEDYEFVKLYQTKVQQIVQLSLTEPDKFKIEHIIFRTSSNTQTQFKKTFREKILKKLVAEKILINLNVKK